MSRLPLHPVDANNPSLRGPAAMRDQEQRIAALERRASSGSRGAGRWIAPSITTGISAGWTWTPTGSGSTGLPPDPIYYQLVTPPGTPLGVAAVTNSGVKVLVPGVYNVRASLLQYFPGAGTGGRVDTSLSVLTSAGVVYSLMDVWLASVPSATAYVKGVVGTEVYLDPGYIVFPGNPAGQAYGDSSGAYSNLAIRHVG